MDYEYNNAETVLSDEFIQKVGDFIEIEEGLKEAASKSKEIRADSKKLKEQIIEYLSFQNIHCVSVNTRKYGKQLIEIKKVTTKTKPKKGVIEAALRDLDNQGRLTDVQTILEAIENCHNITEVTRLYRKSGEKKQRQNSRK